MRLLGELAVLRDGVAQTLPPSKKTRALLAYLIVARAPQPRQRLCDLLWDGPDDPRAQLRWSLTKLRPIVDGPGATRLVADRERVAFDALGAHVDLFAASAHLGADTAAASTDGLRAAATALGGDFLEGVDLPDCYRFHEWCTIERERVRATRLVVLGTLLDRLDHAPEDALAFARQRLTVDPLSDVAHAAVVRLLARLGRKAEARAQVETCKRMLERELGGRRSPALEIARLEIGRPVPGRDVPLAPGRVEPSPVVRTPPREEAAPSLAFVARAREREALAQMAKNLCAGHAEQAILLTGEPGIGKSRLLDDLASRVDESGGIALAGRAFEAESVRPYGIWIDILRDPRLAGAVAAYRAGLAPLLPELGAASSDPETKARLFDAIASLLRDVSSTQPVVLIVDDLHWLDEASSGLLGYITRILEGTPVGLAFAARDGELSDNPAALRFVRTLRRAERLASLPVGPLDAQAIGELVGATSDEAAARIFRESGGNPLFAIEVARADHGEPARTLHALLDERLARLDARARDLVVWAAALGRQFDPELLVRVTGENLGQTITAIGLLEEHGVLTSHDSASYTFTHELIRKAVYRQLSGPRRRLVHLTIARVLEGVTEAWGDVVHHASLADDALLVARTCVTAGDRCLRMGARRQAKDFAERGLAVASRLGPDEGIHLRAELLRIAAHAAAAHTTRRQAFESEAEALVQLARDHGKPEDAATALFVLSLLSSNRADFDRARDTTLRQAAAVRGAHPAQIVPAIANTAFCLALIERDLPKARALLDEARELADAHHMSVLDLDLGAGLLAHFEGRTREARELLQRSASAGRAAQDWFRCSVALTRLGMIALESGAWDEAHAHAAELRDVSTKLGDGTEGITAETLVALARHAANEPDGTARVEACVQALEGADAKATLAFALTTAAETELRHGASAAAEAFATRALRAAEALGKPSATIRAHAAFGRAVPRAAAASLEAGRALVDHPYGISRVARDALDALSNAGTNAGPHADRLRRKKR